MTNRQRRAYFMHNVVLRHLRDIRQHLRESANEMERSYYKDRYDCQLHDYAKGMNIRESIIERYL